MYLFSRICTNNEFLYQKKISNNLEGYKMWKNIIEFEEIFNQMWLEMKGRYKNKTLMIRSTYIKY